MSLLDLPLVSIWTFLEGVFASPDSSHVGGSSGNDIALSSLQAPGPTLQRLDVHLRTRSGGFPFLIPVHPMRLHRRHIFTSHQRDFVSAASPTRRSGACETWVPTGPHRPGSQRSLSSGPDLPEALPICKWAQRPYPQPRRPWKTLDDLIQTLENLPGLWSKHLPRSRWRRRQWVQGSRDPLCKSRKETFLNL
jgi:hypothetical protein